MKNKSLLVNQVGCRLLSIFLFSTIVLSIGFNSSIEKAEASSRGIYLEKFNWVYCSWDENTLSLHLNGIAPGTYELYELTNPPRIVIDIPGMTCPGVDPVTGSYNFVSIPLLVQLRASCSRDRTRIVLESRASLYQEVISDPSSTDLDILCLIRFRQTLEQIEIDAGTKYVAKRYVTPSGQRLVYAVISDPAYSHLRPYVYTASDVSGGTLARISEFVNGTGASVGINGGYFSWPGISLSLVIQNGRIKSPPVFHRPAFMDYGEGRYSINYPDISARIRSTSGVEWTTKVINQTPSFGQIALLTPGHPARIRNEMSGLKAVILDKTVEIVTEDEIEDFSNRYVLWSKGGYPPLNLLGIGETVEIEYYQDPYSPEAVTAIQGGPFIVMDSNVHVTSAENDIGRDIANGRSARTAVGIDSAGRIYLVVVEGTDGGKSIGATLEELGWTLVDLGASWAMNLDGGSSTSMHIGYHDLAITLPAGRRSVATALLLIDETGQLQGQNFFF